MHLETQHCGTFYGSICSCLFIITILMVQMKKPRPGSSRRRQTPPPGEGGGAGLCVSYWGWVVTACPPTLAEAGLRSWEWGCLPLLQPQKEIFKAALVSAAATTNYPKCRGLKPHQLIFLPPYQSEFCTGTAKSLLRVSQG